MLGVAFGCRGGNGPPGADAGPAAEAGPDAVIEAGAGTEAGADVATDAMVTPPDSSDGPADAAGNAACPWRLPGATGGVRQDPVTIATPFAAPDDSLTFAPPAIPCAVFKISDYGAQANGTTKNTDAIARTIAWERANPPSRPLAAIDYAAEDAAIAG